MEPTSLKTIYILFSVGVILTAVSLYHVLLLVSTLNTPPIPPDD